MANLKEAEFGGADLANADLTGADLTGASLVGAYMVGAKLDGEMVSTKPYASDDISEVEETVYVEDTVNPKSIPGTEEIAIATRRDFEETTPVMPSVISDNNELEDIKEVAVAKNEQSVEKTGGSVPGESIAAPEAKSSPVIKEVLIQDSEPSFESVKQVPVVTATTVAVATSDDSPVVEKVTVEEKPISAVVTEDVVIEPSIADSIVQEEIVEQEDTDAIIEEIFSSEEATEKVDTAKDVAVQETVTPQVIEEEPVVTEVLSQAEVVQETIAKLEAVALPDKVMMNIERLKDSNNCYGCDLSGANLSGENLDSADLEGANLVSTILTGADLEGANLKGAILTNADLSGANLSGADLYKADLSGADLTGTILEETLLDDAEMTGVKGYQPTLLLIQ